MFEIQKILNHNAIIGTREPEQEKYLVLGNGIAFGKQIHDTIETKEEYTVYLLKKVERKSRL